MRLHATWQDVIFLHFVVDADELAPRLPDGVRLDRPLGEAWVTLVALRCRGPAPLPPSLLRGLPSCAALSLRAPVIVCGEPALLLLEEHVSSRAFAASARLVGLHPRTSSVRIQRQGDFVEARLGGGRLDLAVRVSGAPLRACEDRIAHRLVERRLVVGPAGAALPVRIEHTPWVIEPLRLERFEAAGDLVPVSARLAAAHLGADGALVLRSGVESEAAEASPWGILAPT